MAEPTTQTADEPPRRAGPGMLWWALFLLLLASIIGVGAYIATRKPDTVVEWVTPPPPEEQTKLLSELENDTATLSEQVDSLRQSVEVGECTQLEALEPVDRSSLTTELDELRQADPPTGNQSQSVAQPTAPDQSRPKQEETEENPDEQNTTADKDSDKALKKDELVSKLRASTVLLIAKTTSGKYSTGTGFFIAADTIITNRHVVEGAANREVMITSKQLGKLHKGQVVSLSSQSTIGQPDFAVLRVAGVSNSQPLALTDRYDALLSVVTGGYPGLSIKNDKGFRDLLKGDVTAAPSLNIHTGEIRAVQPGPTGGELLLHSTGILQGNSGGPLLDRCARVVGVNTFIAVEQRQAARLSYALSSKDLKTFLVSRGVRYNSNAGACQDGS
ncbi:MAG: serine protease [Pseudomonadota bacterium]